MNAAIQRKKKEVQDERLKLKSIKDQKAINDQIDRIANSKKKIEGDQLTVDMKATYVKGLMTMARQSDKTKQFMNNIKQYIREDSEDSECNERDLGHHTV